MRIDRLLSEIIRGLWAIDPKEAISQAIFIDGILNKNLKLEDSDKREDAKFLIKGDSGEYEGSFSEIDEVPKDSVGIVSMSGSMLKYGTWCSYGTEEIAMQLWQLHKHPNIIGIVFITDSGGGAFNSIAPLVHFFANKTKPVVNLSDVCGSACLYGIAGSDHIMASNNISSMFGSIGIVANFVDVQPYYEELGFKFHAIYPEESKHKNEAFKLALKGDYSLIKKEILSPAAIGFQNHIKTHRPNLNLEIEGIISGKMFYANDALEYGLIDSIGDLNAAVDKVRELADIQEFMSN